MNELADVRFAVVRRGYDRAQVDASIDKLATGLDTAVAERESARDQLRALSRELEASRADAEESRSASAAARAEVERLRAQVSELSTIPSTVDGMSERLSQMVRIAQDESNDMRSRATAGATQVLTLAQAEADELRERSRAEREAFEAERRSAEEALRGQLEESRVQLEHLRSDRDGQVARLDAELAERRVQAEQELAAEVEERRVSLMEELTAQETRRRAEAIRILDVASQEARTHVAEATAEAQRIRAEAQSNVGDAHRELDEMRALQHRVSEQLTSVRALLDWTLPRIGAPTGSAPAEVGGPPAELRVVSAETLDVTRLDRPGAADTTADRAAEPGLERVDGTAEPAPSSPTDADLPGAAELDRSARPTPNSRAAQVGAGSGRNGDRR